MKKLILLLLSFFSLSLFGFVNSVYAADFKVDIEKIYEINKPDEISVTEIRTITNTSTNRLISSDNSELFQIIVLPENTEQLMPSFLSAQSYIDGKLIQNKQGASATDTIEIQVPYDGSIGLGQKKEIKVQYINYGLTKTTGALLDIYAPGFGEDYKFENNSTSYTYKTTIKLSKSLGETGFVIPVPANSSEDDNYSIFEISQESLIGSKIWLQLGKSQYYQFVIKQGVVASDSINKGYFNEYNLVIPRDLLEAETEQKVYFTKFDPEPKQIISDEDGNMIATFKIPSQENYTISIEGYAQVNKLDKQASSEDSGLIGDIDKNAFIKYLNAAEFWEVNHPEIKSKADELKGTEANIYKIIESNYNHIIDTIDYSEIKRFGINNRQGALKTLQGGAAVCMEYSDLFLTLARAQGIPARAAFGYGYDARIGEDQQDAHQWVQVYLPGVGEWLSVDVTWGESGPALIGGDLNHFYTHIASVDPNTPPSIQRTSYGSQVGLEAPQFEIQAINSIPQGQVLTDSSQLLLKYPKVDKNQLEVIFDDIKIRIQTANIPASMSRNAEYIIYAGVGLFFLAGIMILKLMFDVLRNKRRHIEAI